MRGLSEYLSEVIKAIFAKEGRVPSELWLNHAVHPYLREVTERRMFGVFEGNVMCYASKDVPVGKVTYFLDIANPAKTIDFEPEKV